MGWGILPGEPIIIPFDNSKYEDCIVAKSLLRRLSSDLEKKEIQPFKMV